MSNTLLLPLITISMPLKNRVWCIRRVLATIENIDYPKHLIKVVFVDDYSTDGTYEVVSEWASRANEKGFHKVEVIRARTNIPQARNICVKRMEGKYLLFWDSDVIPPSELLREMVEIAERDPSIGVIGADYMYEASTGIKYVPTVNKETHAVYMGFTLIRREVFEKVGGFNENLSVGEDTEFCIRVKEKTSYRIVWAPKPVPHLKRPKEVKKPGRLRMWLQYNFTVRAREYYVSWKSLPRFLKLRIAYWLLWPWIQLLVLYNILFLILSVAYNFVSMYLVVKHRGVLNGLYTWVKFNLPTGLALSYGMVRYCIVDKILRIC